MLLTGPYLHCVGSLALWRFSQNLLAKYRWSHAPAKKKFYHLRAGPLAMCIMVNPALFIGLRSQKETKTHNFTRVIHINWLVKTELRGPGPLVVNIIVNYCCTRVLLYVKSAKRNWNWRNSTLFVSFLSLVAFQLGGPGPPGPPWPRLLPEINVFSSLSQKSYNFTFVRRYLANCHLLSLHNDNLVDFFGNSREFLIFRVLAALTLLFLMAITSYFCWLFSAVMREILWYFKASVSFDSFLALVILCSSSLKSLVPI